MCKFYSQSLSCAQLDVCKGNFHHRSREWALATLLGPVILLSIAAVCGFRQRSLSSFSKSGRQRLCLREQEWAHHPGSLSLGREPLLSKSAM